MLNGLNENKPRPFYSFWSCTLVLHFRLFCWLWDTPFLLRDSYLLVSWSYELNLPIHIHFTSIIPRMPMSNLAISCLTISDLPWFLALTFQVRKKYFSLHHWALFSLQSYPQLIVISALAQLIYSFWSYYYLPSALPSSILSPYYLLSALPMVYTFWSY